MKLQHVAKKEKLELSFIKRLMFSKNERVFTFFIKMFHFCQTEFRNIIFKTYYFKIYTFGGKCNIMCKGDNMFNQKNYINNYIKNSYKSIKVRIRKDNALLINKIESVENVNQYIVDLILKDIYENRVYNFINNNILIDFDLSPKIEKLIKEAEEADLMNDYGLYMNLAYAIDAQAKKEVSHHELKESQWNKLIMRYCL